MYKTKKKKKKTIKTCHKPSNSMSNSSENGKKFRSSLQNSINYKIKFFFVVVQLWKKKKSLRNLRESQFRVKVKKKKSLENKI